MKLTPEQIKEGSMIFCVIYTIISIYSSFSGSEIRLETIGMSTIIEVWEWWGLSTKEYFVVLKDLGKGMGEELCIIHRVNTDGEYWSLFEMQNSLWSRTY